MLGKMHLQVLPKKKYYFVMPINVVQLWLSTNKH